ncbi:MAG TPA: hypothetical protein VH092_08465 [Urbifossiella sp.]|nr:hypothetical protein [Urbifossiella sp.]
MGEAKSRLRMPPCEPSPSPIAAGHAPWADLDAIKSIYQDANRLGLTVDHIVPLVSKLVCGLHCEANLQLITFEENLRKSNRFWPDMP